MGIFNSTFREHIIKELNYTAGAGVCEILTNIHSGTAHAGLTTSVGTTGDRGNFSWGRLYTQGANMSSQVHLLMNAHTHTHTRASTSFLLQTFTCTYVNMYVSVHVYTSIWMANT